MDRKKEKHMKRKDLADVCGYLKGLVIPHTPEDFSVASPFRYDLPDDEIRAGISAFRSFLYELYDRLAADGHNFDSKAGAKYDPDPGEDSIYKCFPVIHQLAVILFSLGIHGALETEPRRELTVIGNDLLTTIKPKSEKYNSLRKITDKRKHELFGYLADMGFVFEEANFSEKVSLETTGTFYVTYEGDSDLIAGLKLLAAAQGNIKSDYDKLAAGFMRCDFYPLAHAAPKAQAVHISEFINPQPQEIKDWVLYMDAYLTRSGCKAEGEANNFTGGGYFSYTSRKTKKTVCRFDMGIWGCSINLKGNHLSEAANIIAELPESMVARMMTNDRGCAAEGTPKCQQERYRFLYNGETHYRCRYAGFTFALDNPAERELIQKWIAYELAV